MSKLITPFRRPPAGRLARRRAGAGRPAGPGGAIPVIDEVQKAVGWSESVKRLWDEDTRARRPLKVVLLGSAPLLVQQGLTESLAGHQVDFVVRAGRARSAVEGESGRG